MFVVLHADAVVLDRPVDVAALHTSLPSLVAEKHVVAWKLAVVLLVAADAEVIVPAAVPNDSVVLHKRHQYSPVTFEHQAFGVYAVWTMLV